jgi:glycosyltransferase involved in cell wall biosynthesis
MNLYFWQNCISPHQLAYIKELHKDSRIDKVYLIAPVSTSEERKAMGWENFSTIEGLNIILSPSMNDVERLMLDNQLNTIHLFSGIRGFKEVFEYFKISLKYNIKRGIITEPPFDYKTPLLLHKLRFLLLDFKYCSKIDYVFGMGDRTVDYYKIWSKKWNVFLFGYCVDALKHEISNNNTNLNNDTELTKFVHVGSLIKRKNVKLLIEALHCIKSTNYFTLDIIGDGPELSNLNNLVKTYNLGDKISFLGKLNMSTVHSKLQEYDVLVLPSIRDGWGAVINEGLQSGLFIISSDNCGAKTLIENSNRGIVFKNKDVQSLTNALNYCIGNADKIKSGKQERVDWSACISGVSMASYMVDCLFENEPVIPPWKK